MPAACSMSRAAGIPPATGTVRDGGLHLPAVMRNHKDLHMFSRETQTRPTSIPQQVGVNIARDAGALSHDRRR
jgi:hypothetical protein